jgi:hypothetical protein
MSSSRHSLKENQFQVFLGHIEVRERWLWLSNVAGLIHGKPIKLPILNRFAEMLDRYVSLACQVSNGAG